MGGGCRRRYWREGDFEGRSGTYSFVALYSYLQKRRLEGEPQRRGLKKGESTGFRKRWHKDSMSLFERRES